jgi:hypothetical protein
MSGEPTNRQSQQERQLGREERLTPRVGAKRRPTTQETTRLVNTSPFQIQIQTFMCPHNTVFSSNLSKQSQPPATNLDQSYKRTSRSLPLVAFVIIRNKRDSKAESLPQSNVRRNDKASEQFDR